MLLQLLLMLLVEPQTGENGNGREDDLEHRDPDVGEMNAVGRFAVCSGG